MSHYAMIWGGATKTHLIKLENAQGAVLKVGKKLPYHYPTIVLYKNHFNQSKVIILTKLVAKYKTIIENNKSDAVTDKEKEAAWCRIMSLFDDIYDF